MRLRRSAFLLSIFFLLTLFSACKPATKTYSKTIFAMDTIMTLTAYGPMSEEAIEASAARLFELDALLSVTQPDSEIGRLNAADGEPVIVKPEVYDLIELTVEYSKEFTGYFDLTLNPVIESWGFYTDDYVVPTKADLDRTLRSVNYQNVVFEENKTVSLLNGAKIDLGGIAKGYAAEEVKKILLEYEIESAVLDLGGNVLVLGDKENETPWRIAVRNPYDKESQLCVLQVSDHALVTSGSYQRYFEEDGIRYHHIMDPKTGCPAESDLLSVTVITEDSVYADALSTALFVMGYDRAVEYWRKAEDFEAIFVLKSHDVFCTDGAMDLLDDNKSNFSVVS